MPSTSGQNVAMVSLGCPKNLVDSEKMLALLAEAGMVVGAPMEQAEVSCQRPGKNRLKS